MIPEKEIMKSSSSLSFQTVVIVIMIIGIIALALGGYLTPLSRIVLKPFITAQTWLATRFQALQNFFDAPQDLARALERALEHEGKLFDFSFDFRRSDRLACTELVYRAYHGVGGLSLEPQRRAGRVTVSSEQILDLALDGRGFRPIAVFGAPGCRWRVATGDDARTVLEASYRRE